MAVKNISDRDFKSNLSTNGVTVIDFAAAWCAPCRALSPILEQLSNELGGKVTVLKIDVDESPVTASTYGVMAMPTVMIFKNGQPVERLVGLRPKSVYKSIIDRYAS